MHQILLATHGAQASGKVLAEVLNVAAPTVTVKVMYIA